MGRQRGWRCWTRGIEARDRRGGYHAYSMIGIIERPTSTKNDGPWTARRGNVIRKVSNLVYLAMKDRHALV